jgi:hypothetical protein
MTDAISGYAANAALAALLNVSGLYLALHTSDPSVASDPTTTEVAGGNYSRQPLTFAVPSSRSTKSTNGQRFVMPACTVTHMAVWNAASAGQFLFSTALSPALVAVDHSTFVVTAGDMAVSL